MVREDHIYVQSFLSQAFGKTFLQIVITWISLILASLLTLGCGNLDWRAPTQCKHRRHRTCEEDMNASHQLLLKSPGAGVSQVGCHLGGHRCAYVGVSSWPNTCLRAPFLYPSCGSPPGCVLSLHNPGRAAAACRRLRKNSVSMAPHSRESTPSVTATRWFSDG